MIAAEATLTARQAVILDRIRAFMRENLFQPTIRQIADATGIRSTHGVTCHIVPLVRKKALRRVAIGSSVRYVPVVPDGCCPYCDRGHHDQG